jgi:hypothetical protein
MEELLFTDDEVAAFRTTKALLLAEHEIPVEKISIRELIITTMNCKLKSDTAAEKYKRWLNLINDGMNITSFDVVWEEVGRLGENLNGHELEAELIKGYAGQNIMAWIDKSN